MGLITMCIDGMGLMTVCIEGDGVDNRIDRDGFVGPLHRQRRG